MLPCLVPTRSRSGGIRCGFAPALFAVTLGFLVLSRFLARALQQRSSAERAVEAAQERVSQLASYKTQLELTVAERTAELNGVNGHLEAELLERKAVETALREHDALLKVVTKSAAQLLGAQHEDDDVGLRARRIRRRSGRVTEEAPATRTRRA